MRRQWHESIAHILLLIRVPAYIYATVELLFIYLTNCIIYVEETAHYVSWLRIFITNKVTPAPLMLFFGRKKKRLLWLLICIMVFIAMFSSILTERFIPSYRMLQSSMCWIHSNKQQNSHWSCHFSCIFLQWQPVRRQHSHLEGKLTTYKIQLIKNLSSCLILKPNSVFQSLRRPHIIS